MHIAMQDDGEHEFASTSPHDRFKASATTFVHSQNHALRVLFTMEGHGTLTLFVMSSG